MLARSYVLAFAALLLLAVSGPCFAAKKMSDTKSAAHRAESRRPANSSSVAHPQDPDPYAYGVNWPGRW